MFRENLETGLAQKLIRINFLVEVGKAEELCGVENHTGWSRCGVDLHVINYTRKSNDNEDETRWSKSELVLFLSADDVGYAQKS